MCNTLQFTEVRSNPGEVSLFCCNIPMNDTNKYKIGAVLKQHSITLIIRLCSVSLPLVRELCGFCVVIVLV